MVTPLMEERSIGYTVSFHPESVDTRHNIISSSQGEEVSYNLLIMMPPHRGVNVIEALRQAAHYLSEITERIEKELTAEHHGLVITWSVASNEDVADELIRIAELGEDTGTYEVQGCDLIAMATHGRGGLQRWMMGSITERVLAGTKLPLLIVRPKEVQAPVISEPTQA